MKKILSVLLLAVLLIPVMVKADMGAPETISYTAVIVKEGGVDCYKTPDISEIEAHLSKGEKGTVQYDIIKDGKSYVLFDGEDKTCYVLAEDVFPEGDAVSPEKSDSVQKLDTPVEFKVVVDEVDVREGPSASYKSVGKLKKGYIGTYKYIISSHIYVEEDGLKGWIEMINKQVLTKTSSNMIAVTDVKTNCGVIPANAIVKEKWTTTIWDQESVIEYNGCEDYVKSFRSHELYTLLTPMESSAYEDGKLYETGKLDKEIMTVPKDAKMSLIAESGEVGQFDVLYVEYNGTKGWYASDSYVERMKNPTTGDPTSDPTIEPIIDPTTEPTNEPTQDVAPKDDPKDDTSKSKGMDTSTIVIICCVSAVAIALAAVTTIVLVNKKKKKVAFDAAVATEEPTPIEETTTETVENNPEETNKE